MGAGTRLRGPEGLVTRMRHVQVPLRRVKWSAGDATKWSAEAAALGGDHRGDGPGALAHSGIAMGWSGEGWSREFRVGYWLRRFSGQGETKIVVSSTEPDAEAEDAVQPERSGYSPCRDHALILRSARSGRKRLSKIASVSGAEERPKPATTVAMSRVRRPASIFPIPLSKV